MAIQQMLLGVGASKKKYIDDVFSTHLYDGTNGAITVNTGIDLSGEGGLLWIKARNSARSHMLFDTERGVNKKLNTDDSAAESNWTDLNHTFTSTGFTFNTNYTDVNAAAVEYSSFNFRRSKKFFDVVKYTGTGSNQLVSHNLGSVPGFYVVKKVDSQASWNGYHRSLGKTKRVYIGSFAAEDDAGDTYWNDTAPTSTTFSLGPDDEVNNDGGTYICYLFAHNDGDGDYGEGGDKDIIKCGSYTGNGSSTGPSVDLGFEPQFVMVKGVSSGSRNWRLWDCMRGAQTGGDIKVLFPNTNTGEYTYSSRADFESRGFKITGTSSQVNASGEDYIYIAIRRPDGYVGKPPELGTDVFAMDTGNSSSTIPAFDSNFVVDMFLHQQPASAGLDWRLTTRFNAPDKLAPNTTAAESDESPNNEMDSNLGVGRNYTNVWQAWMWKRHAGFDVVMHSGNSVANTGITHNLGRTPEMIWTKCRSHAEPWAVYHKGLNGGTTPHDWYIFLNTETAEDGATGYDGHWGDAPTSSVFYVGNDGAVNNDQKTYISMLFASVDGISKCGFYDGDGTNDGSHEITLGFQPRFLIIKCRNGNEPWTVFDTTRGWASGSDNYLRLNTNDAQSSGDKVDPTSTGFKLMDSSGPWNDSPGKSYIYYAHA